MVDDGSRVSQNRPVVPITAGYTYFGQFIDHDLTKDNSSLADSFEKEPHELDNQQSPFLDLSHLYVADGNGMNPFDADGIRLKLGDPGSRGVRFDVATEGGTGRPLVADRRSGENIILRQLAAVFARYHNWAIDHCDPKIAGLPELERARLQTCWQFQALVCTDFLETVLDQDVYREVFLDATYQPYFNWQGNFSIPVEFSVAAMRFGHSMVRDSYLLSFGHDLTLDKIFRRNSDMGPLLNALEVEWGLFFQGGGGEPMTAFGARPLDTRIVDPLHRLPHDLIRLFNAASPKRSLAGDPPQLAVRTLTRGAGLRLVSGQAACAFFGISPLTEDELVRNSKGEITAAGMILKKFGLLSDTPLWYYLLQESEIWNNGNRLGPTGSYIVAETVHAAIRYDSNSYVKHPAAGGVAPLWRFPDGNRTINGLSDFFRTALRI